MMYTDQEKYRVLQVILKSKTFSKSTTANVLLKLLVEASIHERELTAADIGREMFGHNYQHEKSEANVRVNIYHLRKKLKKYYDEEGTHDAVIISIGVGQYRVSFDQKVLPVPSVRKRFWPLLLVALLLIASPCVYFAYTVDEDGIWSDLFANDKPTTLYLSPLFGFWGPSMIGTSCFHRNTKINSEQGFERLMDTMPQLKDQFTAAVSGYVTFEDAATIRNYTKLFCAHDRDFVVRKSNDFTTGALKEQNIIYLSPMRYRTDFSDVFDELSDRCRFVEQRAGHIHLAYTSPRTRKDSIIRLVSDAKNYECAIAAKLRGANDTWHYMFFADHGIGLTALSEFFTDPDSIASFSQQYLEDKDEFVAVYYVSGKDRTNLGMDLLFIDAE